MPSRKGNLSGCGICVWLTAAFFLVLLVAGGTFLSLYITLPENQIQPWFPAAGLIFVGTPWLFWITTCFYRSIATKTIGHEEKKVIRTAAAAGGGGGDPATNTMNGGMNKDGSHGGDGAAVVVEATAGRVQQGRNHSNGVGDSSLNSNESEAPLALSMSS